MHRWSKLFIPTLREAPADAEVASHKLLLRAGYIRQLGAGIYSYLPLGQRSINKIVAIVREEMDKIGQEFLLPALSPAEIWQETGRWTGMGENMFRLKDRKGADLCLAMTHEEIMTSLARNELRSYKQLPQIWYQIQAKFRDEPRPKSGLLRVRQFLMKDAYSFDIDAAGLDESYHRHDRAYRAIFARCGLDFVAVEADSGAMGGSQSQEFMVYTEAGEDLIASSRDEAGNVVYAANLEKATSRLPFAEDLAPTGDGLPELIHTPGKRTIEDVNEFLNSDQAFLLAAKISPPHMNIDLQTHRAITPHHQMKTMAYIGIFEGTHGLAGVPIIALLRGDHQVNETKLLATARAQRVHPLSAEQIQFVFGAPPGYLGPIGLKAIEFAHLNTLARDGVLPKFLVGSSAQEPLTQVEGINLRVYYKHPIVILDAALEHRKHLVAGANKANYHYRNVTPGRDFTPTLIADIRNINEGESDPVGGRPLRLGKAVEIGHIFKLGYKYSRSMGVSVLDRDGKEVTPIMGSYGIGIERILTSAIESSAARFAAAGDLPSRPERSAAERPAAPAAEQLQYALPASIAPFEVIVTITNVREPALLEAGETLAAGLHHAGIDVLLDDRDERAGVKFKDAELIGIPYRVNIGKKIAEGAVELVDRLTRTTIELRLDAALPHLKALLHPSNP